MIVLTYEEFCSIINSSQDEKEIVDRLMSFFGEDEPDAGIVEAMLREEETWVDLYHDPPTVTGQRCPSTHPEWSHTRCVREIHEDPDHRYTSSSDGRSVSWKDSDS